MPTDDPDLASAFRGPRAVRAGASTTSPEQLGDGQAWVGFGRGAGVVMGSLSILLALLLLATSACKPEAKARAALETEAREFAQKEGGNFKAVACVTTDSDGDGYVTCTIFYGDLKREDILCTRSTAESGCKAKP